jgi:cell division transport system permease protein
MAQPKLKPKDFNSNIFIAFSRSLQLGVTNFWRNKFLSLATIGVIAVILFIFNTILAVHFIGNQALRALSERVDIVIYLRDDIQMYDAQKLAEELKNVPGVKTVKYTSKEEALDIVAKTHPKTAEFLKKFNLANPLPPSISIITQRPEDYQTVENFLGKGEYKSLMQNYIAEGSGNESVILSSVAKNLLNISQFVRQVIFWLVLVFVLGGTLVIVNAIQLTIYTRRQEISIMRLVGATPAFIRMPFVFEGIFYGLGSVLASFLFLFILGKTIQIDDATMWAYYNSLELNKVFVAEIIVTVVLGIMSSYAAVEQYIHGKIATS